MKKTCLVALIVLSMVFCSACGKKKDESKKKPEPEKASEETVTENVSEFYNEITSTDTRPLAIMIDNDSSAARPQIGLEDAYIVYEIVVEGGATRYMALFKDKVPEKVGPVRSSRHYFLDYAMENDAIYAHAGWSPKAQADISSLKINNINGLLGGDGSNYWRDSTYDNTWHNLYTSVKKLRDYSDKTKKYRQTSDKLLLNYEKNDRELTGTSTNGINIPYMGFYNISYKYNAETSLYERYVNSSPYNSQTGKIITAKNIIVYNVTNVNLASDTDKKGRQDLNNIGSGSGYYISNGVREDITWEKTARGEKTVYKHSDGTELTVNPGNTFIQIVPSSRQVTFE